MLRFLKKHRKSQNKSAAPRSPAHQIADTGAECGRDPKGEHRRERSQLIRPMGLIRLSHQIPSTERVLGSKILTGGLRINGLPRWIPQLQLPGTGVTTQVSAVGCSCRGRRLMFIPHHASTTRTKIPKQKLRGTAE